MKFTSRHAALQVPVKDAVYDYISNPNGRLVRPALWVDFAEEGWMETYQHDEMGGQPYTALAGGGYYDTVEAQRRNGWTDDERQLIEQKLLDMCRNAPDRDTVRDRHLINADGYGDCELWLPAKLEPPVPNYHKIHHNEVAVKMEELGLVDQALLYEQRLEKKRPTVIEKLQEIAQRDAGAAELVAQ